MGKILLKNIWNKCKTNYKESILNYFFEYFPNNSNTFKNVYNSFIHKRHSCSKSYFEL